MTVYSDDQSTQSEAIEDACLTLLPLMYQATRFFLLGYSNLGPVHLSCELTASLLYHQAATSVNAGKCQMTLLREVQWHYGDGLQSW